MIIVNVERNATDAGTVMLPSLFMLRGTVLPRIVLAFLILLTPVVLTACTNSRSGADDFAPVDRAVNDIGPDRFGRVVTDTRTGSSHGLGQPPTRTVILALPGPGPAASARVGAAIERLGFERIGTGGWRRRDGSQLVLVFLAQPATPPSAAALDTGQVALRLEVTLST